VNLSIQGVKGVLNRAGDFHFDIKKGKPQSLAIFGRNGYGKSGYADAVEYLFSTDGEIEHLGKGGADSEQGGKHAIPHVLAEEKGIASQIIAEFIQVETGEKITATRPVVTGRNDIRPSEIEKVIAQSPAHRILRQHDLRHFIIDMKPGEKFSEFARWIGFENSVTLLKHLTTVENTLKDTDVDREIAERLQSIKTHTSGSVTSYDQSTIFKWCEQEVAKYINETISIHKAEDIEKILIRLRESQETLVIQSQAAKIYQTNKDLEEKANNFIGENGGIELLQKKLSETLYAEQAKNSLDAQATQSVFNEVWEKAQKLFTEQKTDVCPICLTSWDKTIAGSQDSALIYLDKSLAALTELRKAKGALQLKQQELKTALQEVEHELSEFDRLAQQLSLPEISDNIKTIKPICKNLSQINEPIYQAKTQFQELIDESIKLVTKTIAQSIHKQIIESSSPLVKNIETTITNIEAIKESILRLDSLTLQQTEIRAVEQKFIKIAERIRIETKSVVDSSLDVLREDINLIYKEIHPEEAIPNINIDLDAENKTFNIRVGFHSADRQVPPGGYLSEAQINTLGLAIFLSSVRRFNKDFPFVFLDDIVSSYDADCRARIVDVLAEEMNGFQIFLTTHDERFYNHLKGRLEKDNWIFERIASYDFDQGPRRESDNLRIDQIDALIKQGDEKIAGNAVRQFMEEWFDNMCEKLCVYTIHKRSYRDYQRTLFDYWDPFIKSLHNIKGEPPKRILESKAYDHLQGSLIPIINFYSHNQANPYEWPSLGDVEYVWTAFKDFLRLFYCDNCGKLLRYQFEEKKLYCTCGGAIIQEP
jgi:hypothetical protein